MRPRSRTEAPRRPVTLASHLLSLEHVKTITHGVVPLTFIPAMSPCTPNTAQPDCQLAPIWPPPRKPLRLFCEKGNVKATGTPPKPVIADSVVPQPAPTWAPM